MNYLAEQQGATVEELSRVFRVTPANIRHHLSILIDQGCVEVAGIKAAPFKGRPSQIYRCIQPANNRIMDSLANILLSELKQNSVVDNTDQSLRRMAGQLVGKYQLDTSNPTRRLYSSIRVLNQMGYQAHWEAHGLTPHIMLDSCPYRSLVGFHPEICQLDRYIIEKLLSSPVELTEKNALSPKGLPQCVIIVREELN